MNYLTPESEQREYIERAKREYIELLAWKNAEPVKVPQYERD